MQHDIYRNPTGFSNTELCSKGRFGCQGWCARLLPESCMKINEMIGFYLKAINYEIFSSKSKYLTGKYG
jgi:hypothetical protein